MFNGHLRDGGRGKPLMFNGHKGEGGLALNVQWT